MLVRQNELKKFKCCLDKRLKAIDALIDGIGGANSTVGIVDPNAGTPTTPNTYINSLTNSFWVYDGTEWFEVKDRMYRDTIENVTAGDLNVDGSLTFVVSEGSISSDVNKVNLYVRVQGQDKEYTVGGAVTYVGSTGAVTIAPGHVNIGDVIIFEYYTA